MRTSPVSPASVTLPDVPPPVSGGWQPGDPVGHRQFFTLPAGLDLEAGGRLETVRLAYESWGTLAPDGGNAVLVHHALTADSHVAGPAGPGHATAGWWDALIGPGRALDTDRYFVVCPNALGGCQGSTGPGSAAPDGRVYGSAWPTVTLRDGVSAEAALADSLGIDRWALALGGSMGGMRTLEWAVGEPDRVARAIVLASTAASSAEQIAWCAVQLAAIRADPLWNDGDYYGQAEGPWRGLGLARRVAHVTYRSEPELQTRFGRDGQPGEPEPPQGRFAVQSYLDHHADKLVRRFDAGSYVALTQMMDGHDVGRGRGGLAAALAQVTARMYVAGIDTDRLYPLSQQQQLADLLPGRPPVRTVTSVSGHDGFLLETDQVGALIREALADI